MRRKIGRNSIAVSLVAACAALTFAPPAAAAPAPTGYGAATRVLLERTGGFAGVHDSFVVDRSTVGGQRSLRLVESYRFRALRASYVPKNSCCDRFFYQVTVTYRGGFRKTVSTVQGADAPRVLSDVISAVERAGVRPFGAAPVRSAA
ncbi:MAG: protealysin inhibitor emfourin [Actinoplanes sp.]